MVVGSVLSLVQDVLVRMRVEVKLIAYLQLPSTAVFGRRYTRNSTESAYVPTGMPIKKETADLKENLPSPSFHFWISWLAQSGLLCLVSSYRGVVQLKASVNSSLSTGRIQP